MDSKFRQVPESLPWAIADGASLGLLQIFGSVFLPDYWKEPIRLNTVFENLAYYSSMIVSLAVLRELSPSDEIFYAGATTTAYGWLASLAKYLHGPRI